MCAKKTPTTPTKQNPIAGITKSPAKKVALSQKQTTKTTKLDDSVVKSNAKINLDAKKLEPKATATSNKKTIETKPVNKSVKKANSRDNSADNAKGKKLQPPPNGKTNKIKPNDSDRDKLSESKSNHIKDNKLSVGKSDEAKAKCNEQCNKIEKSSSTLSMKSNGESDNVIKDKEKNVKKMKVLSPATTPKKEAKKIADKAKSSKVVKKTKMKISNELKNLGIEMSKSNSSLAVVIQEGMTGGVKTSICEMVKTKARFCSNVKGQNTVAKAPSNKVNKESQEKSETKTSNEMKTGGEQIKLIEMPKSEDKKASTEIAKGEAQVNSRNKISALVNAKNKNKVAKSETITNEIVENKMSDDSEAVKAVKRKYVKKKKIEDGVESLKSETNDKLDDNKPDGKSTEVKDSQALPTDKKAGKSVPTQEASLLSKTLQTKAKQLKTQEPSKVKRVQLTGEKSVQKLNLPTAAEKIKRKYVKKIKTTQVEGEEMSKKPQNNDAEKSKPLKNERDQSSEAIKVANESQKNGLVKTAEVDTITAFNEKPKNSLEKSIVEKKTSVVDLKKNTSTDPNKSNSSVDSKTTSLDSSKKLTAEIVKKSQIDSQKSSDIDQKSSESSSKSSSVNQNSSDTTAADCEKLKEKMAKKNNLEGQKTPQKILNDFKKATEKVASENKKPPVADAKKSPDKLINDSKKSPTKVSKDLTKVESQGKLKTKPSDKNIKLSPKKQKVEVKEEDPLALSSESENSSNSSDSGSEEIFKKPSKPPAQRNLRHKQHKQITFKRTRVASLNAIAKVHCFYENEARSTMDANILMAIKNSLADHSSGGEEDEDDDDENENEEVDFVSKR